MRSKISINYLKSHVYNKTIQKAVINSLFKGLA